jgi:prolyl-tRNA synthetase
MRWSQYYLHTTREVPADAEVVSHQLMLRSGMIKKLAAGIYSYLPLGWRSMQKLMAIVRRELDRSGAIELTMPAIQPAELWQESGRWQRYGKELLRLKDRHERDFCFGPTHEEVITDIARRDLKSYRQLPVNLYQIQVKFRDEIRPRFGLMRGREFLMKDAYSFHASAGSLDETYGEMERAYRRIFEACDLDYTVVEADTGTIGGSASHEFMVVAATGESAVVRCPVCGYAANVEKAETRVTAAEAPSAAVAGERQALREVATPGKTSIAEVAEFLGLPPERFVKTLVYATEDGLVGVLMRGDREVNEVKRQNHLGVQHLSLAGEDRVREATGAPVGFAGPIGLTTGLRLVGDRSLRDLVDWASGANKADAHYVGGNWGRDADLAEWADLLLASGGDPCPRCYGLGIGRTVAAAIEQNHDADGIVWPLPLAPFAALVVALNPNDPEVARVAGSLYDELREKGIEVLYDDRDERPGVKFKDADLIGVPVRVVVGAKSLADGKVEVSLRRDRVKQPVPPAEAAARVAALAAGA